MKKVHSLKGDFLEKFSFNIRFVRFFKDFLDPELVQFWEEEKRRISQEINNHDDSFNKKDAKVA